jgi:lysozyme family protein
MAKYSFGELQRSYAALWKAMQIPAGVRVQATDARVRAIAENKPRYDQVANATGVPWYVIGMIHEMEGGLNFSTHLHNGDPLTRRTVQVPAGRPPTGMPPFQWEDSAIDALGLEGFPAVKLWTVERIAYQLEAYNGWGYRSRDTGVNTPYLWSATSNYRKGKFVRDGVFDPNAVSGQIGAMALLRRLIDIAGINVPAEEDVPLPDAPPLPSEADLGRQPYPGVVVRLNHPDPAVVMVLQRRLNQLGCWSKVDAKGATVPLDVDGDFGQLTASAIKLFQARSSDSEGKPLSVDGVAGPTTWAALFGTPAVAPVSRLHPRKPCCSGSSTSRQPRSSSASARCRWVPIAGLGWTSICALPGSIQARAAIPGARASSCGASTMPRASWGLPHRCRVQPACTTCGRRRAGPASGASPTMPRSGIRARFSPATCSSSTPVKDTDTPAWSSAATATTFRPSKATPTSWAAAKA